jgi:hypothetical protein
MTDSQVDILFSKLQEQGSPSASPLKTKTVTQTIVPPNGKGIVGNMSIENKNGETIVTPVMEIDNIEIDEKFESKKQQKYFFAKCNDKSLSKKEQNKWCKMADEFAKDTNFAKLPEKKKETKENFDFGDYGKTVASVAAGLHSKNMSKVSPNVEFTGESEIEKQIMRLVEKHITPKMSKKDFNNLLEGDTKTAPAKPKEREKEKKPGHPFKPDPDKKGAPKAKKTEMGEDTKTAPAKPKVNPGTKPKHPFQPDPNKKGAPKAIKKELPSFLKFNALGLNK